MTQNQTGRTPPYNTGSSTAAGNVCKVLGIPGRCLNGRRTSVPPVTGDGFFFFPLQSLQKKKRQGQAAFWWHRHPRDVYYTNKLFLVVQCGLFSFNDQRNERRFQLSCVSGGLVMLAVYLLLPRHIVRISPRSAIHWQLEDITRFPPRNQGTPRLFVVALYGWFQMVFVKLFYSILVLTLKSASIKKKN